MPRQHYMTLLRRATLSPLVTHALLHYVLLLRLPLMRALAPPLPVGSSLMRCLEAETDAGALLSCGRCNNLGRCAHSRTADANQLHANATAHLFIGHPHGPLFWSMHYHMFVNP